jgi:hypothetical protein
MTKAARDPHNLPHSDNDYICPDAAVKKNLFPGGFAKGTALKASESPHDRTDVVTKTQAVIKGFFRDFGFL